MATINQSIDSSIQLPPLGELSASYEVNGSAAFFTSDSAAATGSALGAVGKSSFLMDGSTFEYDEADRRWLM